MTNDDSEADADLERIYLNSETGETTTLRKIAYYGWKEGGDVKQTSDGILLDEELHKPVDEISPVHDNTSVYSASTGDTLTFAQIAMASAKGPSVTVEEADDVEDGYLVDGDLYTPVGYGGDT